MSTEDTTKLIAQARRFGTSEETLAELVSALESLIAERDALVAENAELRDVVTAILAATSGPGDGPSDAEMVAGIAETFTLPAIEKARAQAMKLRAERDEFKRLFSECHPVHLSGVVEARALRAQLDSIAALVAAHAEGDFPRRHFEAHQVLVNIRNIVAVAPFDVLAAHDREVAARTLEEFAEVWAERDGIEALMFAADDVSAVQLTEKALLARAAEIREGKN